MNIVGFIFARGGSKGIRQKNVALLAGEPLIAYSIRKARASRYIERVIVSTEDEEIADVARTYGAEVPFMRPPELATDAAIEIHAWKHALEAVETRDGRPVDIFVNVPTTAPLFTSDDLDRCISEQRQTAADMVICVCDAHRNPFFNMFMRDSEGFIRLAAEPETPFYHRQEAPRVLDIVTGAYVATADYVRRFDSLFEGRVRAIDVPPERAIDIDTAIDLKLAEFLLAENRRTQSQINCGSS